MSPVTGDSVTRESREGKQKGLRHKLTIRANGVLLNKVQPTKTEKWGNGEKTAGGEGGVRGDKEGGSA